MILEPEHWLEGGGQASRKGCVAYLCLEADQSATNGIFEVVSRGVQGEDELPSARCEI